MSLDKQVNIYSIDTSAFYTYYENLFVRKKYEFDIYKKKNNQEALLSKVKAKFNAYKKLNSDVDWIEESVKYKRYTSFIKRIQANLDIYNAMWNRRSSEVKFILNGGEIKIKKNVICYQNGLLEAKRDYSNNVREILPSKIKEKDGVSMFDSSLTRQLGLKVGKGYLNDELFIVRVYYFHILKDLMDNGYMYNGNKYIFFGCSAGQIRQKKAVFIKEELYNKHEKNNHVWINKRYHQ